MTRPNHIDKESLQLIESTKIKVNEQDPNALGSIKVEGVKRMPKGIEPLVFATEKKVMENIEKIKEMRDQFGFKE
jgi:hypothetical protein